jgi:hypothetical protein
VQGQDQSGLRVQRRLQPAAPERLCSGARAPGRHVMRWAACQGGGRRGVWARADAQDSRV